jgi:hypothetical protein
MSERGSDAIAGHAALTVGRGYGAPSLKDKAAGLKRFPRYQIAEQASERGQRTTSVQTGP